jgi:phospholipid transport system substrate-binding protein
MALLAAAAVIPARAGAAGPGTPMDFVKAKQAELQALAAKTPDKAVLHQGIRDVMESFVDYGELSKRTLADRWATLKKKEQADFTAEFKQMIQRSYVKRFEPGTNFNIVYEPDVRTEEDGAVTVGSTIQSGRSEAKVEYVLKDRSGRWWAFDVVIDDVSMVRNYRKQFHDIWAKEGFPGLMARLRKKNAARAE